MSKPYNLGVVWGSYNGITRRHVLKKFKINWKLIFWMR